MRRGVFTSIALVVPCVFLGDVLGAALVRSAGALDPDSRAEEARALDRVLPRALARIAPSILKIRPASAADLPRRTRTAIALERDLAVMDGTSIDETFVDDLVVEDMRGNTKKAHLLGRDLRLRLVLVEVEEGGLVPAPRSTRAPLAGTFVLTVGSVFAEGRPTAAFGIVSTSSRFEGRAIQVDAAVDPSNAGGAVLDLEGALLGIPVIVDRKIGDDSGVGFAVPFARIEAVLPRLRAGEELKPGMLGIALATEERQGAQGVKVEGVLPGGAAKAAGIETEDVIVSIDGQKVSTVRALVSALAEKCAGDRVELVLRHKGAELTKRVTLGVREARK
ncbi:PDZ domain-containing protein [bacterium]|nr:PDZ domain-containing protein [bacterium]